MCYTIECVILTLKCTNVFGGRTPEREGDAGQETREWKGREEGEEGGGELR